MGGYKIQIGGTVSPKPPPLSAILEYNCRIGIVKSDLIYLHVSVLS